LAWTLPGSRSLPAAGADRERSVISAGIKATEAAEQSRQTPQDRRRSDTATGYLGQTTLKSELNATKVKPVKAAVSRQRGKHAPEVTPSTVDRVAKQDSAAMDMRFLETNSVQRALLWIWTFNKGVYVLTQQCINQFGLSVLCGGMLEYLHCSPESRKRQWNGNPMPRGITGRPCSWDLALWVGAVKKEAVKYNSYVLWDLDPRVIAPTRPSSNWMSKVQTYPLAREGTPHQETHSCHKGKKCGHDFQIGAQHQERLASLTVSHNLTSISNLSV
jgi:hypothetical protein